MPMGMKDTHDNLMPGVHVKVLTKHQVDGQLVLFAAPSLEPLQTRPIRTSLNITLA